MTIVNSGIIGERVMPLDRIFAGTLTGMEQALNLRMEKQGLIQSNIANMETPGYTVRDFSFQNAMEAAVATEKEPLARTDKRHFSAMDNPLKPAIEDMKRPVDLDEEMMKLAENQLMYEVVTRMVSKKLDSVQYAIEEGGK